MRYNTFLALTEKLVHSAAERILNNNNNISSQPIEDENLFRIVILVIVRQFRSFVRSFFFWYSFLHMNSISMYSVGSIEFSPKITNKTLSPYVRSLLFSTWHLTPRNWKDLLCLYKLDKSDVDSWHRKRISLHFSTWIYAFTFVWIFPRASSTKIILTFTTIPRPANKHYHFSRVVQFKIQRYVSAHNKYECNWRVINTDNNKFMIDGQWWMISPFRKECNVYTVVCECSTLLAQ